MGRSVATAKKAGTLFESEVAKYLTEKLNKHIIRMPKTGAKDSGDIHGVTRGGTPVAIECKSPGEKSNWSISGWWSETEQETLNIHGEVGFLIVKKFRKSTSESICIVDESMWKKINGEDVYGKLNRHKAIGFAGWYDILQEEGPFMTKRRGKDSFWVVMSINHSIEFMDKKDEATVIMSDEDFENFVKEGEIKTFSTSGSTVTVKRLGK